MSLINRMLQDLDKRQAGQSAESALPLGVQVTAAAPRAPRLRSQVAALAVVGLALAAAFHFWEGPLPFMPKPEIAVAQPVQIAAPVPAVPAPPAAEAKTPVAAAADDSPEAPPVVPAAVVEKPIESRPSRPPRPLETAPKASAAKDPGTRTASAAASSPVQKNFARTDLQNLGDFHYRQSLDAYAQGRTTESLGQAREALKFDPDHLDARQLLLRQLVEQREIDAARTVLREGLQRHPEQAAWIKLAVRLELEKGDLTAARALVEQAPPAAVAQADFQALAGMLAQRQGRQGDAADHFRAALGRNPADGRSWIGLGLALEAQGHEPEARESFRRALATEGLPAELQTLAQKKTR